MIDRSFPELLARRYRSASRRPAAGRARRSATRHLNSDSPGDAHQFKQKTGIDVKVVALGTGQALDTARRGNAREAEEEGRLKDRIVDVKEGASPANVKIKVGGGIIRRRLRSSSSNLQGAKPPTRSSRRAISWSS